MRIVICELQYNPSPRSWSFELLVPVTDWVKIFRLTTPFFCFLLLFFLHILVGILPNRITLMLNLYSVWRVIKTEKLYLTKHLPNNWQLLYSVTYSILRVSCTHMSSVPFIKNHIGAVNKAEHGMIWEGAMYPRSFKKM